MGPAAGPVDGNKRSPVGFGICFLLWRETEMPPADVVLSLEERTHLDFGDFVKKSFRYFW